MDNGILLLLVAQGLCIVVWAALSFRAIFRIRAIAAGRTGQRFPGPVSFKSAMGVWVKEPARRNARVLWVLSLLGVMVPSVIISLRPGGIE